MQVKKNDHAIWMEYGLNPHLAAVKCDLRLVLSRRECVLVVAPEGDGVAVVPQRVVIPPGGVDAGVGEVLPGVLAQKPEEAHLNRANRVVADL